MARRLAAIAAVASSIWGAALSLAAVPIYVSRLGIEAYGLIGFFITTQAVLQMLDLGLAPAVNREVARSAAIGELAAARSLLHTLSRIYWAMAALIGVTIFIAAPFIATTWLQSRQLPMNEMTQSLALMGMLVAARWPIAVYQNTLIGVRRLGSVSLLNAGMSTVSVGLSIAAVSSVPRVQAVFAVQAACSLLHVVLMRQLAWRALDGQQGAAVDFRAMRRLWQFTAGMGGVALTSIALTQLDKVLLSKLLPLDAFGEYMLAATVVGGLSVFIAPLFNTIYPELSALVALGDGDRLVAKYHRDTRLFAIVFLPIVIALGIYAQDLVWLWTGNRSTATDVAPIIELLCIGSGINGLMFFPYSLQLAHGSTWMPLSINSSLLILLGPLIVTLATAYGGLGGAAAWAVLEVVYFFVGVWMTHRYLPIGSGLAWIRKSIAMPLALTCAMALLVRPAILWTPPGTPVRAAAIALGVLVSIAVCALAMPDMRARLIIRMRALAAFTTPA